MTATETNITAGTNSSRRKGYSVPGAITAHKIAQATRITSRIRRRVPIGCRTAPSAIQSNYAPRASAGFDLPRDRIRGDIHYGNVV